MTTDVYPSWDAVFKERPVADTFKKVHSDKDYDATFDKLVKSRDLSLRELLVVEDKITPRAKVR